MKPIIFQGKVQNGLAQLPRWSMLLGLFLLICGAKLWLINEFGNATPFWDQWNDEASLIKAYLEGTFSPMQFFETHNQSHIAYSQMLVLFLFWINKQWDPILQMVAQAPLHAIAIASFVFLTGTSMSGLGRAALACFAGCLGILPFGWENTLWGDQSCFYFSMLFGIVVIWLCWRYEALTPRWWLGTALGFAGLFSLASGSFPILALIAFLALRLIFERGRELKRRIAGMAIMAAVAAYGVASTANLTVAGSVIATTFKAFFWALTGILSWPCDSHWACVIIQAPLVLLALVCVFRRVPFDDCRWFVIIAGADFWIQALATSYYRGNGWTASRYCDSWSMLLIIICSCLYFLRGSLGKRWQYVFCTIAAIWLFACSYGALERAVYVLPGELMDKRTSMLEMENNVREYLITGNTTYLQGKIPYPKQEFLQQMLDSDSVRRVLPSNLLNSNPPLSPLREKASEGFEQNAYPDGVPKTSKTVLGSYGKSGAKSEGSITLEFKVPPGSRQMDIQVAGYPSDKGMDLRVKEKEGKTSYSIAPSLNPGANWQTLSVYLNPKSTSFNLYAKDRSDRAWLALSMPVIAKDHPPGRWARSLTKSALYFIDIGLVLLAVGAAGGLANGKGADSSPTAGAIHVNRTASGVGSLKKDHFGPYFQ